MEKYFDEIFKLMYSPIITPYNLLDNAKLDNYSYVKYYKKNNYFITEMKCQVDENETLFFYYFDDKNFLQKIYMEQEGIGNFVFDRKENIEDAKLKYYKLANKKSNKKII